LKSKGFFPIAPFSASLLNHVDLKIKLRRSRDAFVLVADAANYKIKIKEMALYVRKVQLSPAVRMGHVKALEKTSVTVWLESVVRQR
jgi:hypothetical protein